MRKRVMASLMIVGLVVLAAHVARAQDFGDSSKANVLREYGTSGTNLVTATYDVSGVGIDSRGSIDGSGSKDQFNSFNSTADSATVTYTLAGPRLVGSYKAELGGYVALKFILEGWNGTEWVELANIDNASGNKTGVFDDLITVTKIRYRAIPTDGGNYFQVRELHVYSAEEALPLTSGHNLFRDQVVSSSKGSATVDGIWANCGDPNGLKDYAYGSALNAQTANLPNGTRAFVAYTFAEPVPMKFGCLGGYDGQNWGNWECYTANDGEDEFGDPVPPTSLATLAANDFATIQEAGWILQTSRGAGEQAMNFAFNEPGEYKYLALVWNVQFGACAEFELFAPITHTTVDSFTLTDADTGSTTYTKSRTLNVTSFTATPSELGTAITGYAVTQSEIPPAADDPAWVAEPPATCNITGDTGMVDIYGWARDDVGDVGGTKVSIKFRSPQDPMTFNDSAKANVLRQLDPETGANLVTVTRQLTGCSQGYEAINDGSGLTEQLGDFNADTDSATWTFTLPGERTVGSYMVELTDHKGASWVLEGFNGTDWVELARKEPMAAGRFTGSFDPIAVTELRCSAAGPSASTYLQIAELHVYLTSGQTVLLTDGYDYLADQTPLATSVSQSSTVWVGPSGTPTDLRDRNYQSHVKAQENSPFGGTRAFLTCSFSEPTPMSSGTLGGYHGQAWSGWTVYTASGDTMPALQGLGAGDPDTIQAAGWTLQHAQSTAVQSRTFLFAEPGDWQHVALVWPVQWDAEVELELRGASIGPKLDSFAVSDQSTGSSLVTNSATVDVAITTAPPDADGTFMITETDTMPALDDPGWGAAPADYTILGGEGTVTLYAWFKDDAGSVTVKSASILYSTAPPVISNVAINAGAEPGSAVVTWTTDVPTEGGVNYGTVALSGATPDSVIEGALGTEHSVTVSGLDVPAKNYKFVLVNNEIVDTQAYYWPKPWPIDGDANGDCRVNILDLIFIRNKLNLDVASDDNWKADVNQDTRINILDLIFVRNKLNTQCP